MAFLLDLAKILRNVTQYIIQRETGKYDKDMVALASLNELSIRANREHSWTTVQFR